MLHISPESKNAYWIDEAIKRQDISLCAKLEKQDHGDYSTSEAENQDLCKAKYTAGVGDITLCRSLEKNAKYGGARSQRDVCLEDLAVKLNMPKLCEEMTPIYIDTCKKSVYGK